MQAKMTANKRLLVSAVKAHAELNYESDGWDIVVECYSESDILEIIGESYTPSGAIAKVRKYLAPIASYRDEIIAA